MSHVLVAVHVTPAAHDVPPLQRVLQSVPLQVTPPFWQLLLPVHETSHVSAVQVTPAAHDVPWLQTTVHESPLHETTPF
jgi:hypothetical protein